MLRPVYCGQNTSACTFIAGSEEAVWKSRSEREARGEEGRRLTTQWSQWSSTESTQGIGLRQIIYFWDGNERGLQTSGEIHLGARHGLTFLNIISRYDDFLRSLSFILPFYLEYAQHLAPSYPQPLISTNYSNFFFSYLSFQDVLVTTLHTLKLGL